MQQVVLLPPLASTCVHCNSVCLGGRVMPAVQHCVGLACVFNYRSILVMVLESADADVNACSILVVDCVLGM
jgi:hypothetical protein